jgi:hypothetical protein
MFQKLKSQHGRVNSMKFFDRSNFKKKKIKSICLESETILEELEEYLGPEIDQNNHTFIVPRVRNDSIEAEPSSFDADTNLFRIVEKREEDQQEETAAVVKC